MIWECVSLLSPQWSNCLKSKKKTLDVTVCDRIMTIIRKSSDKSFDCRCSLSGKWSFYDHWNHSRAFGLQNFVREISSSFKMNTAPGAKPFPNIRFPSLRVFGFPSVRRRRRRRRRRRAGDENRLKHWVH